jgi:hypothetical protein
MARVAQRFFRTDRENTTAKGAAIIRKRAKGAGL